MTDPAPSTPPTRLSRARGRLRAAVVVAGLGVAATSGVWLTAHAAPEEMAPTVVLDASDVADAPTDASSEAFCRAYGLPRGLDGSASVVSRVNTLRGQADDLATTGTPDDIQPAARRGFEVYAVLSGVVTPAQVEAFGDGQGGSLDGGEVDGEALRAELGLDTTEATDLSVFVKYAAATCFTTVG